MIQSVLNVEIFSSGLVTNWLQQTSCLSAWCVSFRTAMPTMCGRRYGQSWRMLMLMMRCSILRSLTKCESWSATCTWFSGTPSTWLSASRYVAIIHILSWRSLCLSHFCQAFCLTVKWVFSMFFSVSFVSGVLWLSDKHSFVSSIDDKMSCRKLYLLSAFLWFAPATL